MLIDIASNSRGMTRRRRSTGSSSWRPGSFPLIAALSNLCFLGFLLSSTLPSVAAMRSSSLTITTASQQRRAALEAAASAASAASALQLRPPSEVQLLPPFLALTMRGGASQSSSLMGRILRAWRGSSKIGGSIYGRMKRFLGALWSGKSSGTSNSNVGGRSKIRSAGGGGEGMGGVGRKLGKSSRVEKHLGTEYRRGNANFRIQKVRIGGGEWCTVWCGAERGFALAWRGIELWSYCTPSMPLDVTFFAIVFVTHSPHLQSPKNIGIAGVASQPHGQHACGRR